MFWRVVELEGVEPSSKQGNHTLSTRLFQTSVFEQQQDLDHQLMPQLLNLIPASEPTETISDLTCAAESLDSEQHPRSDVSFNYLVAELSLHLLCFDQAARAYLVSPINFSSAQIMEGTKKPPRAYVPSQPAVKSSQPQIYDVVIGCKDMYFF